MTKWLGLIVTLFWSSVAFAAAIEVKINKHVSVPEKRLLAIEVMDASIARIERHPLSQRLALFGLRVGTTKLVRTLSPHGEKIVSEIRVVDSKKKQKKFRENGGKVGCVGREKASLQGERCPFLLTGWDAP